MLVFVYLEVDDKKQPVYEKKFRRCIESIGNNDVIIASEEYSAIAQNKDCILTIPEDIMNDIDKSLISQENRALSLSINKNAALSGWINQVFENKPDIDGILLFGRYYDFVNAAQNNNITVFYSEATDEKTDEIIKNVLEKEKQNKEQIEKMQSEVQDLQTELRDKNEQIAQFHNRIGSLQTELYNRKNQVKALEEQWETAEKKVDRIEDEKFLYLKMYKGLLSELDATKVELLNTRKK